MSRRTTLALVAIVAAATTLISSCQKSSLETTFSQQEDRIDSFIEGLVKNDVEIGNVRVTHNKGSNRVTLNATELETDGEKLRKGGMISFYYAGYTFSGSTPSAGSLFSTNHPDVASNSGWELSGATYDILTVRYDDSLGYVEGLMNGLEGVQTGEECYIVFSGKYGFGNKFMGGIPKNSALIYHVWVSSINNE